MIMPNKDKKSKVGRNDPCPCGSGLKLKKCCMNNPVSSPSPSISKPKYKMMRACHWSQDEIREMTTNEIVSNLRQWGIPFDEKEFKEGIKKSFAARDIYKQWEERFVITAEHFDEDFIWMACEVLWERLAQGKISTEQIDDMMQAGYDLIEEKDEKGGCELWLKVWEELKPRFTPDMKSIKDAEAAFKGYQCLFNWCQDLEMELTNAGRDDKVCYEYCIRYVREFCKLFPESDESILYNMRCSIGESLFMLGRKEEGEKEFQAVVKEYPENPWVYIHWGDMYGHPFVGNGEYRNPKRAEELYRKGLGLDENEDKHILDRIKALKGS